MTWRRSRGILAPIVAAILCAPVASNADRIELAPGDVIERSSGGFSYTLELISNLTQTQPVLDFTGPYYYLVLTNTSASPDDFFLDVNNLSQPTWFPQVCLRQVCFPFNATLTFDPAESDTIGVNVVPDTNGVGTWDFDLNSVGDPGLNDSFQMTLYAGTAATGVNGIPTDRGLYLAQNSPNPAPGRTSISFSLARDENVRLGIYDVAGRLVASLADGPHAAGVHTVRWDGTGAGVPASPGVYFYRLSTPSGQLSRSLTLVR